jgi:hypothetical protein
MDSIRVSEAPDPGSIPGEATNNTKSIMDRIIPLRRDEAPDPDSIVGEATNYSNSTMDRIIPLRRDEAPDPTHLLFTVVFTDLCFG